MTEDDIPPEYAKYLPSEPLTIDEWNQELTKFTESLRPDAEPYQWDESKLGYCQDSTYARLTYLRERLATAQQEARQAQLILLRKGVQPEQPLTTAHLEQIHGGPIIRENRKYKCLDGTVYIWNNYCFVPDNYNLDEQGRLLNKCHYHEYFLKTINYDIKHLDMTTRGLAAEDFRWRDTLYGITPPSVQLMAMCLLELLGEHTSALSKTQQAIDNLPENVKKRENQETLDAIAKEQHLNAMMTGFEVQSILRPVLSGEPQQKPKLKLKTASN